MPRHRRAMRAGPCSALSSPSLTSVHVYIRIRGDIPTPLLGQGGGTSAWRGRHAAPHVSPDCYASSRAGRWHGRYAAARPLPLAPSCLLYPAYLLPAPNLPPLPLSSHPFFPWRTSGVAHAARAVLNPPPRPPVAHHVVSHVQDWASLQANLRLSHPPGLAPPAATAPCTLLQCSGTPTPAAHRRRSRTHARTPMRHETQTRAAAPGRAGQSTASHTHAGPPCPHPPPQPRPSP